MPTSYAADSYPLAVKRDRGCFSAPIPFIIGLCFWLIIAATADAEDDKYAAVKEQITVCAACHGDKGDSVIPLNPTLGGQHLHYIYVQLKDMKSGLRANQIMQSMLATVEKSDMLLLAEYYSEQEWKSPGYQASADQVARAKKNITAGQCVQCHLGGFEGGSGVPRVAGQHYEYLHKTMTDFKTRHRTNSAAKNSLFKTISDEDIKALAAYFAGL